MAYNIYAKGFGKLNEKPIKTKAGVLNLINRAYRSSLPSVLTIKKA